MPACVALPAKENCANWKRQAGMSALPGLRFNDWDSELRPLASLRVRLIELRIKP